MGALIKFFPVLLLLAITCTDAEFMVSPQDLRIVLGKTEQFELYIKGDLKSDVEVFVKVNHSTLASIQPSNFTFRKNDVFKTITVTGLKPGQSIVNITIPDLNNNEFSKAFVRFTVERYNVLFIISNIIGWIYFLAWSISFYPQIYINYKRKSVEGLNFDFLSLNVVGFIMYSLFNCGLYWIPEIEQEYLQRNPTGLNPVQVNDIVFALHAVFATLVTILQCFIYETGSQRISTTARLIHGIFAIVVIVSMILSILSYSPWLNFLYHCSYVKLTITLIKYIPQAVYNYKRQSTVGWSIGNIFLDFTGGILSMLQMILNAYNYDDWASIFGDPTKFGLGFFSVSFDVLFIVQHYVLYREQRDYETIPGANSESCEEDNSSLSPEIQS